MNNKSAIGTNTTSPGRECEPAGASGIEELCKRLEDDASDYADAGFKHGESPSMDNQREAATLIRRLVAERDNARAECTWLAKLLIRLREALNNIAEGAEDEGDRVYFGSTNDADWLKEIACEVDSYAFDRIMRESKWLDYIESSAKANARATAAEAEVERLRAALKDATAHLAAATSSYRRFCRKGVTGDALFSTKLSDYQKATNRARTALEGKNDGK